MITIEQRKKGKQLALLKITIQGAIDIVKTRNIEIESHMMFPAYSIMAKFQTEQRLQAVIQTPAKYFKPNGKIDKRRQKRGMSNYKSYTVGVNI